VAAYGIDLVAGAGSNDWWPFFAMSSLLRVISHDETAVVLTVRKSNKKTSRNILMS